MHLGFQLLFDSRTNGYGRHANHWRKGEAIEADLNSHAGVILVADDDLDIHFIVKCALEEVGFRGMFQSVKDGLELLDYLCCRGKHKCAIIPDLIILDLNMPQMDGRSALREIKTDPALEQIPVAVLTTSRSQKDMDFCGRFSGCSYANKPASFEEWTRSIDTILRRHLPLWDAALPILEEQNTFLLQQ